MDNILDHVVVQGQSYDIVSPTAFGDYIETIGSACINPDGYAKGSTFLAKVGNEQFYYEATAAITQGSTISEGTNCKKTTVAGREAELAAEIDSVNEALTNLTDSVETNGSMNLCPNNATSQVIAGVTFTVNSDRTVTADAPSGAADATLLAVSTKTYPKGTYRLSGCPSGGSLYNTYILVAVVNGTEYYDTGNGIEFTLATDESVRVSIVVYQPLGAFSNLVFKPMITLASQPNSDYAHYVPYAMTNRELTERVDAHEAGTPVELKSYYGSSNKFIAPADGYIRAQIGPNAVVSYADINLFDGVITQTIYKLDHWDAKVFYIKKGVPIYWTSNSNDSTDISIRYVPLQ